MTETVLQKVLTQKQKNAGLCLVEPDDHTVELKDKEGRCLAVFSSGAMVMEIRKEADKYIKRGDCKEFDIDKALDEISVTF